MPGTIKPRTVIVSVGFVLALTTGVATLSAKTRPNLGIGSTPGSQRVQTSKRKAADTLILANAAQMIDAGRQTFRFDTFGDEAFWGDTIHLHQAIAGAANGGVGPVSARRRRSRWD